MVLALLLNLQTRSLKQTIQVKQANQVKQSKKVNVNQVKQVDQKNPVNQVSSITRDTSGVLAHQGSISKVNVNADSVRNITS